MITSVRVDWSSVEAVIFDVDGTLYDQRGLRRRMIWKLLSYYICRPWKLNEILVLRRFRNERERRASIPVERLERAQYEWAAEGSSVSTDRVRSIVQQWLLDAPLGSLCAFRYPDLPEFLDLVSRCGLKTAVFSDYPAEAKLDALGISVDRIACATDDHVDRLKPDPRGLLWLASTLGVPPQRCLMIGDREDRDGECARRAEMAYLILNRDSRCDPTQFSSYRELYEDLRGFARS